MVLRKPPILKNRYGIILAMKLINEDTMRGCQLTTEQAEKVTAAITAGKVFDGSGDAVTLDDIQDCSGDIVIENDGFLNCLSAAGVHPLQMRRASA